MHVKQEENYFILH